MNNTTKYLKYQSDWKRRLNKIELDLLSTVEDTNYYFFVLRAIADRHFNAYVKKEAMRVAQQQNALQDEYDYLMSCLLFLNNQIKKKGMLNQLDHTALSHRYQTLKKDVSDYLRWQVRIQQTCFRLTDNYFDVNFERRQAA